MSRYSDAVERGLKGLRFVSTGSGRDCDECREAHGYTPVERYGRDDDAEHWECRAEPDAGDWATEEECEAACRVLFADAWSDGRVCDEGNFSWSPCGVCGCTLGGNRETWHWLDEHGNVRHENDACSDCVLFLANGDESTDPYWTDDAD